MKLKNIVGVILPDADRETAFNLNREHGLRLTVNERKEHARWLHVHYPALSEREIARRTGIDHVTVNKAFRQGGGENHQSGGYSYGNNLLLSAMRVNAAKTLLRYTKKLWITRGLRANFDRERAVNELAAALREQSELSPDYKLYLQVLKAIVDLATSKATIKSH
jgi:AraC-like DNA-binding protein